MSDANFVVPVAILAASFFFLLFRALASHNWVQLSQIMSLYFKSGRINAMKIVSSAFLSSLNLSFRITSNLPQALTMEKLIWSC